MTRLHPFMRLKVKGDTYFLPDPNGGVYFRNNLGSFRMEGKGIDQWIEQLIPVFNGENTLEDLTDELPEHYRERVYEIAEWLYRNSFVRDVSQDRPHQLSDAVLEKYAAQIEFLDSFGDSGAYRFQSYREVKMLAVGSGPFFVSLVRALFESGLPKFHICVTDTVPTNRKRLEELVEHARITDPDVSLEEVILQKEVCSWREIVQQFDSILYVSQEGDVEELRMLHSICREEEKLFLPAMCVYQVGLAGPLVHPDSELCWESAWRRIHRSALCKNPQFHTFSSTAGAMLANVIVFEWFKTVTGVNDSVLKSQFFLLDLETLEGNWHFFFSHPLVNGSPKVEWVKDLGQLLKQSTDRSHSNGLLPFFSLLTSTESGIFHTWEEGDLPQLPLAQCRVQVADPLSEGPAERLPEIICTGLTHEEARREAGLIGIETYVSRMVEKMIEPREFVGVGVGETIAEVICRALQKCLADEQKKQQVDQETAVSRIQLGEVRDERCRFYLQALTTLQGAPIIGLGQEVSGFPVVWVGMNGCWYHGIGLNVTVALRQALQMALLQAQNPSVCLSAQSLKVPTMSLQEKETQSLDIPACEEKPQMGDLQTALQVLESNHKQLLVFDLTVEPFLKEELAGAFGVLLREEDPR